LLIANEYRAYRHLAGVAGVPRLIGRIDACGLAIEWIDGELLATAPDRIERGAAYVGRLRTVIDAIHATGLVHLDLRSNKNIVLARDGKIIVVDFGTAIRLRPGGLAHRLLFEFLRLQDLSGYLKWKRTLDAGPLTEEEQRWSERHARVRPLWRFNRKRPRARD
jgi:serine/threonine protein kinase